MNWYKTATSKPQQKQLCSLVQQHSPLVGDNDCCQWNVTINNHPYRLLFERWGWGCVERAIQNELIYIPAQLAVEQISPSELLGPQGEEVWSFVSWDEKLKTYQSELKRRKYNPILQSWSEEEKYDYDAVSWLLLTI